MKSKKTSKTKTKDTKTKGKVQKHKKLTPEKMKIIKGGQSNPNNAPTACG